MKSSIEEEKAATAGKSVGSVDHGGDNHADGTVCGAPILGRVAMVIATQPGPHVRPDRET